MTQERTTLALLVIGDEILSGKVEDDNSRYLIRRDHGFLTNLDDHVARLHAFGRRRTRRVNFGNQHTGHILGKAELDPRGLRQRLQRDSDGVECDYCHKLTNPDDSEHQVNIFHTHHSRLDNRWVNRTLSDWHTNDSSAKYY